MKTQVYKRAALGLTLAIFPCLSGCDAQTNGSSPSLIAAALAQPVVQTATATNEAPASPLAETSEPATVKPTSPAVPAGEVALPPSIRPSSPLAEIVKLAQSGVEAGVMLTYITNSSSTFGLGADEIVYLNDIGLPGEVITTMMEHDKAMQQFWAAQAQAQQAVPPPAETAPAEPTAVAPSYENPPQAEPVPAEAQPANVTYNTFYDTLSPYGSWVNVDGYGMCWQPSVVVVNRGWQPYRDGGRWIYSDAGWYWYSDYTWGWAPFHYGRWLSHPRYGWCWNPGYTWGPSWVSWRYTDGYCGWAPLPPEAHYSAGFGFTYYGSSVGVSFGFGLGYDCYTFVPWNRFCNYRPSRYCAPGYQSKQIYYRSTVVNNVIIGDNNTIINRGVPVERVTAATKRDIQKVAIRDVASMSGRRERLDGQTLAVHRPQPPQNSFARNTTAGGTVTDENRSSEVRTRPSSESRGQQFSGQRPASRLDQKEELAPTSSRSFAGQRPAARPAETAPQTGNSVATRSDSTTSKRELTPRPIDVPSTRPVERAVNGSAGNPQITSSRPERSTVAPLVVRGSDRVDGPTARQANPQANSSSRTAQSQTPSLVVIGKRDNNTLSQRQGIVVMPQPPTRSSDAQSPAVTMPERENVRPTAPQRQFSEPQSLAPTTARDWTPPAVQRQESPRPTRSVQPQDNPRPSYSAPVQRSSPTPPPQDNRPSPSRAPEARPQPSAPATSAPRSSPPPPSRSESSSRSSESRSDSRPRGRN